MISHQHTKSRFASSRDLWRKEQAYGLHNKMDPLYE